VGAIPSEFDSRPGHCRAPKSAIALLDAGHRGLAARHMRRAVAALIEAPVDWDAVVNVRGACARFLTAIRHCEGGLTHLRN